MKKIYLISGIVIILGMVFAFYPGWFRFLWGWQILSLPLIAGMLMVLAQNEDRSHRFLPKLVVGSLLTSFVFVCLWWWLNYDHSGHFYIPEALYTALFFAAIIIFGGLVGIVIRGTNLLIKNYAKNKQ
jgi:hypothetical protein